MVRGGRGGGGGGGEGGGWGDRRKEGGENFLIMEMTVESISPIYMVYGVSQAFL